MPLSVLPGLGPGIHEFARAAPKSWIAGPKPGQDGGEVGATMWTGSGRVHMAFAIEGRMQWPKRSTSLYFRDPDDHCLELATPGLWRTY